VAHTIEIDFDVYKLIENERRGFDDTPLSALRRLLKLPELSPTKRIELGTGRAWMQKGVTLDHGTLLRMEYNRRVHEGQIVDGRWLVEGKLYDSPSGAAVGVARTKSGKQTALDGWEYWNFKRPGSNLWAPIMSERPAEAGVSNKSAEELGL
jgi:hypothetical protein